MYAPRNYFCMIWVIFWMPTDQVMAFLCFISDNQSVDMSGQGWGGGRTTDTRVIPDNGVTRTNTFGKKKRNRMISRDIYCCLNSSNYLTQFCPIKDQRFPFLHKNFIAMVPHLET